jgi:hypothetical protein
LKPLESCPICEAPAREADAHYRRGDDALVRCRSCGLLYSSVRRSREELKDLYAAHYYGTGGQLEGAARAAERERNRVLYRAVLDDLVRRYPHLLPKEGESPPRVLD